MKNCGAIAPADIEIYKEKYSNVASFTEILKKILSHHRTSIKYLSESGISKAELHRIKHGDECTPPYAPTIRTIIKIAGWAGLGRAEVEELMAAANPRMWLILQLAFDGWDYMNIDIVLDACGFDPEYSKSE